MEKTMSAASSFVTREGVDAFWSRVSTEHELHGYLSFPGFLSRTALRLPDKTALVFRERRHGYRSLFRAIGGVTRHLREVHGVRPGDRVAMLMDNSDLYAIWYLAILAMGAVAVPLNIKLTPSELVFMVQDSGSTLLLSEAFFTPTLEALAPVLEGRCGILLVSPETQPAAVDMQPDAVAIEADAAIYYTSGTTGRPRGVVHTHRSLIAGALQGLLGWEYSQEWVVALATTPLFHIAFHTVFLPTLVAGGTLVIDSFKIETVFELIACHRVTYFFGVPTMLLLMAQTPKRSEHDLSSVVLVTFGAAPMPAHKLKVVQKMFPNAALIHGMGQTECCGTTVTLPSSSAFAKAGSVGIAIPGTDIRIVDAEDRELPPRAVGELVTRGPNLMRHYLGRPDATAQTLRGGWLHTGDLGYRDEEGYVYLVDRQKDMIIRGGENIYSTEVEQVLTQLADVSAAAVIGVPHEVLGEEVMAFLVAREGARELTLQELQAHCARHLAKFKWPVAIRYLSSMPQTATGKIQKGVLRAMMTSTIRERNHD